MQLVKRTLRKSKKIQQYGVICDSHTVFEVHNYILPAQMHYAFFFEVRSAMNDVRVDF